MRAILATIGRGAEGAAVLLDTCAILYIALAKGIKPEADEAIGTASRDGFLYVSPVSAWEIGMGVARGRLNLPMEPLAFFSRFIDRIDAKLGPLSPEILVHSTVLPAQPHKDPMDRVLMATARLHEMILVTSDRPILAYGKAGHLRTLAC
jgi:PIN domain nuclease of toxin-antitoxin system